MILRAGSQNLLRMPLMREFKILQILQGKLTQGFGTATFYLSDRIISIHLKMQYNFLFQTWKFTNNASDNMILEIGRHVAKVCKQGNILLQFEGSLFVSGTRGNF